MPSPGQVDRFLHLIKSGHGPVSACEEIGVTWPNMDQYFKRQPELAQKYKAAVSIRDEKVEAQLHEMACDGNLAAIKFYLTNRCPKRWSEAQPAPQQLQHAQVQINIASQARLLAENPEASQLALNALNALPSTTKRPPLALSVDAERSSPAPIFSPPPADAPFPPGGPPVRSLEGLMTPQPSYPDISKLEDTNGNEPHHG